MILKVNTVLFDKEHIKIMARYYQCETPCCSTNQIIEHKFIFFHLNNSGNDR